MAGLTRYNRYPRDYLGGTRTLSLEAKGLYNDLIDSMYDTGRPLPYDLAHLCRLCGVRDKRTLQKPLKELMDAGKIRVIGDTLVNDRTMVEIDEATQHIENGRGGGRPRKGDAPQSGHSSPTVHATAPELQANSAPTHGGGFQEDQALSQNPPKPTPRPIEEEERSAGMGGAKVEVLDLTPVSVITEAPTATVAVSAPGDSPPVQPSATDRDATPLWRRIIRAFDEIRVQVFGQNMARMCPATTDKTFAERWIALGIDEELCRAVFLKKCTDAKRNNKRPPDTLSFCGEAVEDAIADRCAILARPFEGKAGNVKERDYQGGARQSPHGALFAAGAAYNARLREEEFTR